MPRLELRDFILGPIAEAIGCAHLDIANPKGRVIVPEASGDRSGHQSPQRLEKIPGRVRGLHFLSDHGLDCPASAPVRQI